MVVNKGGAGGQGDQLRQLGGPAQPVQPGVYLVVRHSAWHTEFARHFPHRKSVVFIERAFGVATKAK